MHHEAQIAFQQFMQAVGVVFRCGGIGGVTGCRIQHRDVLESAGKAIWKLVEFNFDGGPANRIDGRQLPVFHKPDRCRHAGAKQPAKLRGMRLRSDRQRIAHLHRMWIEGVVQKSQFIRRKTVAESVLCA